MVVSGFGVVEEIPMKAGKGTVCLEVNCSVRNSSNDIAAFK